MPDRHTILDPDVKDPLFAYIVADYANAGRKLAKFRDAQTDRTQISFLVDLVGRKLKVESTNLLNPEAKWIKTIECRVCLGMIPSVCKEMSRDIKLRQMDKTNEDKVNAVVIQIKGENCNGEPAIGICFPEDEDDCALPNFLLAPNDRIVKTIDVFKKGVFGCNCSVSSRFETEVTLSLVSEGLCITSEIQKRGIQMFLEYSDMTLGGFRSMHVYEKEMTKTPFGACVHKRISSLVELKHQLVNKLWKHTGRDGDKLKYAISNEFARLESTNWRTGAARGGASKKYKVSDDKVTKSVRVIETMHGPTSFLLRVAEGSWGHNKFLATKNMLLADTKQIIPLVPDEKFYSDFIDDLNSYVKWLERQRRK